MVGFCVELAKLGAEVGADLGHDLFAAAQDLAGERTATIRGCEDQMGVKVVDHRSAPANIGIWFSPW